MYVFSSEKTEHQRAGIARKVVDKRFGQLRYIAYAAVYQLGIGVAAAGILKNVYQE